MSRPKASSSRCNICRHQDRILIEMARLSGASLDAIAGRFSVKRDSVWRHMENHVSLDRRAQLIADVPLTELASKAAAEGLSLLEYLSIVRSTVMTQMLSAASVNDRNATANLAGRAVDVLRETGRLTGELLESARVVNNININQNSAVLFGSPAFSALETMLLRRLAPFPEALRAVVEGLLELQAPAVVLPVAEGFHAV